MRRTAILVAMFATLALVLTPSLADAQAGRGSSSGSRGSRTYTAPPATSTAPSTAAPMQRSTTAPSAPMAAAPAPQRSGLFGGSPFMAGLMGGLIGAGIGGMLFGGGMFGGMSGASGFLGFLLQIGLVAMIGYVIYRLVTRNRRPALAGMPSTLLERTGAPDAQAQHPMARGGMGLPGGTSAPVAIAEADFQAFEQLLKSVQAAWSQQDVNALRTLATPEMVSYFADQLAELASRGLQNQATDIKLEQGDLAEAWAEDGRDYATVAMRFSMLATTRDGGGRVVEGDAAVRTQSTEVWTFVRVPGGRWLLSAIQQTS